MKAFYAKLCDARRRAGGDFISTPDGGFALDHFSATAGVSAVRKAAHAL